MASFECNNQESQNITHHSIFSFNNPRPIILRYGREELIALYNDNILIPDEIKDIPEIFSKQEHIPFSLSAASESEQRNLTHALCSSNTRTNQNFKPTSQRPPFSRTILNSSKIYSRAVSSYTSSQTFPTNFNDSNYTDNVTSSAELSKSPSDISSPSDSLPSGFSDNYNRQFRTRDSIPNKRSNDKQYIKPSAVTFGSWRSSGNYKSDNERKQFFPNEIHNHSELPEWLSENPSDMDAKAMTFDNQGKFVRVNSSEGFERSDQRFDYPKPEIISIHKHPIELNQNQNNWNENQPIENEHPGFDMHLLKKHLDVITNPDALESSNERTGVVHIPVKWYYIDPQQTIRGPFSDIQMTKWYAAGYFTSSILMRRSSDTKFARLGEYINALGPSFIYSHEPIRGFSELIDAVQTTKPKMNTNDQSTNWVQSNQWNAMDSMPSEQNHMKSINHDSQSTDNLENLFMNLLAQSKSSFNLPSNPPLSKDCNDEQNFSIDANVEEIAKRLGFNDPSVMAISAGQPTQPQANIRNNDNQQEEEWQKVYKRPTHKTPFKQQVKQSEITVGNNFDSNIFQHQTSFDHNFALIDQQNSNSEKSSIYDSPSRNVYDLSIGEEVKFVNSKISDQKLAPWATSTASSAAPHSFLSIQMEEERIANQRKKEEELSAQEAINSAVTTAPIGWRSQSFQSTENFSKIQLEEMRKSQAGIDNMDQKSQFQQEGLNRLRQLQKSQETKPQDSLNWAQWLNPSDKIWKQEFKNFNNRLAEQARTTNKDLTGASDPTFVSWASDELTSMYGPKINAQAVIHLLCKFNAPAEIESFIRQSFGTHTKVSQFAINFHEKLAICENNHLMAPVNVSNPKEHNSIDSANAFRTNQPNSPKKRSKRKS